MKFDHVAIVVKDDLEAVKKFYGEVFGACEVGEWEAMNTKCVMLKYDNFGIELLYSLNDSSPIASHPGGLRHATFLADNLDEAIEGISKKYPELVKQDKMSGETDKMKVRVQFLEAAAPTANVIIEIGEVQPK